MTNLSKGILFNSRISGVCEENKIYDFYETPTWGIELLLDNFKIPPVWKILEPCNGMGSISNILIKRGCDTTTFDINPEAIADKYLNFLQYDKKDEFDLIITNPPFKFNPIWEFAEKALKIVRENGYVIMLNQISKLEGQKRKKFYEKFPLKKVLIHSKRYKINGGSGIGYAWYIWQKGYKGETILKII